MLFGILFNDADCCTSGMETEKFSSSGNRCNFYVAVMIFYDPVYNIQPYPGSFTHFFWW